jgi:hypothetical protein
MTGLEFKDYVTKPVALKMADRIACQMEKRLRFIEKINHLHSCPFSHIRDFKMALDIIDGFVDIHHLVNDIKYYNDFIKFVRENGGFKVE